MLKNAHNFLLKVWRGIQAHEYIAVSVAGVVMYFLSFLSYTIPLVGTVIFVIIVITAVYVSYHNLWYGMLFVVCELIVGSLSGALFFLPSGGEIFLTLRKFLWLVVFVVWLIKALQKKRFFPYAFLKTPLASAGAVIGAVILWGIVRGFWTGVGSVNIYHDANGYVFFLLMFPLLWAIAHERGSYEEKEQQLYRSALWGIIILALFSLFLLLVFSYGIGVPLYGWLRDSRIAEIGKLGTTSLYRVFIQSHIILLVVFFMCALSVFQEKSFFSKTWVLWILVWSGIIMSLSRSFWFGLGVSGIVCGIWLIVSKQKWNQIQTLFFQGISSLAASLVLIALMTGLGLNIVESLNTRSEVTLTEPAVQSRWELWPVLVQKIEQSPLLGHGFGTTVTYETADPRLLERGITHYTTYAFEWGYLDIWLKMGLVGLLAFVYFEAVLLWYGWKWVRQTEYAPFRTGWWFGMLAIFIVHFFTPYLNHPIGIGVVIFFSAFVFFQPSHRGDAQYIDKDVLRL